MPCLLFGFPFAFAAVRQKKRATSVARLIIALLVWALRPGLWLSWYLLFLSLLRRDRHWL